MPRRRPGADAHDDGLVGNPYWPLFDLRLTGPHVVLRPCTEVDLPHLAAVVPADAEPDPRLPRHDIADPHLRRGAAVHQSYWQAWATWSPTAWRLPFVVALGDDVVGTGEVEAEDFARRRVVETGSWLVPDVRGRGVGKELRAALLHLAFTGLGALVAETAAWHDNGASLGVSRSLGYEPNGETLHVDGDRRDRMVRMRITADAWARRAGEFPTAIAGLDACRHLFGVAAEVGPPT